jgi:2-oxoglutarate ferredoxin oxidoreductase subunit beta
MGSVDYPVDPVHVALGAGATFVARTLDVNVKHIQAMLKRVADHEGTAFLEIYQNCNIFNDGAFAQLTDKETKLESVIEIEHGKPLRFGKDGKKGIIFDQGMRPRVVDVDEVGESALYVHDETNELSSAVLSRLGGQGLPTPIGVFRAVQQPSYEDMLQEQVEHAAAGKSRRVQDLLDQGAWSVE